MDESFSKFDLFHTHSPIRFSLRGCLHKRNYSINDIDNACLEVLINRLQHIEESFTWKTFSALGREKGLTKEKKDSESYKMIQEKKRECEGPNMGEDDFFYHFRVKDKDKVYGAFRVFGYQKEDLFCITHFDVKGKIHKH